MLASAPASVFLNMDPMYFMFRNVQLRNQTITKIFNVTLRLIIGQCCVFEVTRTLSLQILYDVSVFSILFSCLKQISQMSPKKLTVHYFSQLQCIIQVALHGFRISGGHQMLIGFCIAVSGTWVSVVGWKLFPLAVYLVLSIITIVNYTVIWITVPKICQCYTLSKHMLKVSWQKADQMCRSKNNTTYALGHLFQSRELKQVLRSMRHVTWYYGTAIFDEETFRNFYGNVFDRTVDMILLLWSRSNLHSVFCTNEYSIFIGGLT